MNFSQALEALKTDQKIKREEWAGTFIFYRPQTEDFKPTIILQYPNEMRREWKERNDELLAEEWEICYDN